KNIVDLKKMPKVDGIALLVAHNQFKEWTLPIIKKLMRGRPVLLDVKNYLAKENKKGMIYKTL
ncbi:MAG: hypothetical protein Q8L57_01210, partial [bacterium]|nr:hypothetical protein [bacterium]